MKQIITKEMVKKALGDLKATGKTVTLAKLHAALENKGSMSTLVAIKAEIDSEAQPSNDSEEGLKTFREVWALAREEGKKLQETVIADLKNDLAVLVQENERLDGVATASANRVEDFKKAKAEVDADLVSTKVLLGRNQELLIQAGTDTKSVLEKLNAEQVAHQNTQKELARAIQKAHELELKLARVSALLEVKAQKA